MHRQTNAPAPQGQRGIAGLIAQTTDNAGLQAEDASFIRKRATEAQGLSEPPRLTAAPGTAQRPTATPAATAAVNQIFLRRQPTALAERSNLWTCHHSGRRRIDVAE
jgi:hypothetical protein